MSDSTGNIVGARAFVGFQGKSEELFLGQALLREAEGGIRVEDGEDHLEGSWEGEISVEGGQLKGGEVRGRHSYNCHPVGGLFVLMGAFGRWTYSRLVPFWQVTYAHTGQAWTHNPYLESLPLWVLCLYLWVNAYEANIADNHHEM